ncbi:MAG: GatB/YqeY domain-containing protein [Flavobacteriales bacterium]|nr:GatB/YqeY domain-containing protein [Flavobacteriales bacterium]MDP4953468.1 GatB/YqeY domain-containing protein [Flavobacteriales bacterium]
MNITEQIQNDIKEAMKAKDRERLSALRDIKSKLLLEMTKDGGDGEVDENAALKILNKLYKQRTDAAAIYKEQNREDLYEEEMSQAEVIKSYLPEPLSNEEIEAKVQAIISDLGASGMGDMGKVMGQATAQLGARADGKTVSAIVRKLLA